MDYMSDGEIVTFYRQAADPKKQIGILADLNATTKDTIIWILNRAGALTKTRPNPSSKIAPPQKQISPVTPTPRVPDKPQKRRNGGGRGKKMSPERHQELLKLYNEGLGDTEIAKRIGLANGSSICTWRKKHGLPSNRKRGWNGRKKKDETIS